MGGLIHAAFVVAALLQGVDGLVGTSKLQAAVEREATEPEDDLGPLGECTGFQCVERYIDLPDPAYGWHELPGQLMEGSLEGVAWKGHVLNLTSQKWLGENDTDHQTWSHPMVVVVPENLDSAVPKVREWATLIVGGANLPSVVSPLAGDVQAAVYMAVHTRAVAIALMQVPNQPLAFKADVNGVARMEDQIKAYTWHHLEQAPGHPEWAVELPNAKAAVRAMDAAEEFSKEFGLSISRFGVTGCSKRANAAMMACGHDPRCELLMPCSMTVSSPKNIQLSQKSLGSPPFAAKDYIENEVFAAADMPDTPALFDIVDGQSYIQKLTMPKLWLNAANDDFFMPDHISLFWSELPESKYLFQKESSSHVGTLDTSTFLSPAAAFTSAVLLDKPLPEIDWVIENTTGDIVVRRHGGEAPMAATVWSAKTCESSHRRDFRLKTMDHGKACWRCGVEIAPSICDVQASTHFSKREELDGSQSTWRVSTPAPTSGWEAFFVTFEFSSPRPGSDPLSVSTGISIVPLSFPFPECHGAECSGEKLVLIDTD